MKLWTILIISVIGCSTEKNNDLKQNIFVSAVKSAKVTVTGKVAKGKISQARVDAYRLNADGTCNTGAGNLASALTDGSGDYTLTYLKTGAPICVIAVPNGNSKMYDEGTDTEIDWTGSTSLTMIIREPSGSTKTGMNVTPFSRIIASRLATIAKANKGTAILDKQVTFANKATAVMFGFTKGFTKSLRADSSVIDMDKIEDVFDSGINLNDSSNSKSKYMNALLGAMSVAAGKTKKSTKITSDDVEKYMAALAEDIADGAANGTNSKGEALSVNGTAVGSTPLTGTLMAALAEYVSSKPSLGITSAEAAAVTFNQSPVFLQSVSSESGISITYPSLSYSFTMGLPISSITPTLTGTVTSCTISPALPAGMILDSTTCVISGTPTAAQPAVSHSITANSGSGETATATISITVKIPVIYAGTGGGLSISINGGTSYTNYTMASGLGSNSVTGVYSAGSTVYASTSLGLSISMNGGTSYTNYTTAAGLGNNASNGVFAVGSAVYAATTSGLSISANGGMNYVNYTTASGLGDNYVNGVYTVDSTVYAATTIGLSISLNGGTSYTNYTTAAGLGNNLVRRVYAVGSTVYAATAGGLSISVNGGTSYTNYTTANGLGNNDVYGVYAVGSTVYAATNGGLSISVNGGTSYTNYTTAAGLGSNSVRGVYAVGSTVYAATTGGLSISANGGANYTNYTTAAGLGGSSIMWVHVQ